MRIAVLSPRDPVPVYTGLLERVYQLCRHLGTDHEVQVLFPYEKRRKAGETGRVPDDQPFRRVGLRSRAVDALERAIPDYSALKGGYHLHPWLYPQVRRHLRRFDPAVVVVEFPYLMPIARAASRDIDCTVVLTEHNVEYRLARRVGVPLWRVLYRYETFACDLADTVVTVSESDRDALVPHLDTDVSVRVAPNGVDVDRYHPANGDGEATRRIRREYGLTDPTLVYHGNLGNAQNEEAVEVLLEDVFPPVRQEYGDASLLLVGADPPAVDRSGVVSTGVVDDLPAHLAAADVAAVPLRSGSGTKLKILEYLASGVPVVTTPVGTEGLPLQHGEHVLVADSPARVAGEALRLLRNDALYGRLRENGRELVVSGFSWSEVLQPYDDIVRDRRTVEDRATRR